MVRSVALVVLVFFCSAGFTDTISSVDYFALKDRIVKKYTGVRPRKFSAWIPGIKHRIKTREKIIALTLDACGGKTGSGYDRKLIEYLIRERVPATIFLSGMWIDANRENIGELLKNGQFDIENHGHDHRICSVVGYCKYSLKSTRNVSEAVDEIELNARKIESLTGKRPVFYRSGGAHYDDVALKISGDLGHIPLNYTINPMDYSKKSTVYSLSRTIISQARNGSIILMHMNHPERNTRKALEYAIPLLKKKGFAFVSLRDYINSLE